jgi:hypothetical protein
VILKRFAVALPVYIASKSELDYENFKLIVCRQAPTRILWSELDS